MASSPSDAAAERYAHLAGEIASSWAEKILSRGDRDGHSPELQMVAAVVLDLRARVAELEGRCEESARLARNLGSDMLSALYCGLVEPEEERTHDPLHYIARGWRRDHDRIWIADCSEGREVDAAMPDDLGVS